MTADHVRLYKRALLEAGLKSATVARRLSVLRGAYKQLAAKGLVSWEAAQDIAAINTCVTALGDSVRQAQRAAYNAIAGLHFDGMQYRTDIGHRALARRG